MAVGSITLALNTAANGLLVTQQALGTVADNVANANTEGYSRKIVQFETNVLAGVGVGVNVADVGRSVDEELQRDLRDEVMDLNKISSQTTYYDRLQELFGSPADNSSIAHTIGELTAAFEQLSVTPERGLEQSEVARWGQNTTEQLQDMTDNIQDLRKQADDEIHQAVREANLLLEEVADLNVKIVRNEVANLDTSALEDKRDLSLNQLSEIIDLTYFERSNGAFSVFTKSGTVLIDEESVGISHNLGASVSPTTTYEEGDFSPIYVGAQVSANDITQNLLGGKLAGLVEMRDSVLPGLQAELDELGANLRDKVNEVHNRGVAFPGLQAMSGTTTFLDSATQQIDFSSGDTRLAVMDVNGNQVASVSLGTQLATDHGAGPWTLDQVATTIQGWLNTSGGGGTASFTDGKLNITLSDSNRYLSIRDESATTQGSSIQDAGINFYGNGTNVTSTASGFSDFFGLNDFFTEDLGNNIWQTAVLSENYSESGTTLTFYDDSTGALNNLGSLSLSGSLDDMADDINAANINIRATVISEGDGVRLRLTHESGDNVLIYENAGNFLNNSGMEVAEVRVAQTLKVRDDIAAAPGNISRSILRYDANLGVGGEYYVSAGDNDTAQKMADLMNSSQAFEKAGGISVSNETFNDYASSILALNSSKAANNSLDVDIQESLVDSLQYRNDSQKGVNLDEELSQLILYEQAYSAAARVISVIQSLFDTLDQAVR